MRGDSDAQLLALHLVTGPSATMIGLYYLPLPTLAHELGWGIDRVSISLTRVAAAGFAAYDAKRELVWVFKSVEFEFGDGKSLGERTAKGIANQLQPFGDHPFVRDFLHLYGVRYRIGVAGLVAAPLDVTQMALPYPIDTPSAFAHPGMGMDPVSVHGSVAAPDGAIGDSIGPVKPVRQDRMGENLGVGMWQTHERGVGLPGLKLNDRESGMIGAAMTTAREAKVDFDAVLAEWFRPEWKAAFGWSVDQFAKRIRTVINTLSDPSMRPRIAGGESPEPKKSPMPMAERIAEERRKADEALKAAEASGAP